MAQRIHGRNGRLYAAITSGGSAEPIAFLNNWSIQFNVDNVDVTSFGDPHKVYVAGLPDASGGYSGFFDHDTQQFYTAATDGVARKMYLYPVAADSTKYFWGTVLFDFSVDASVDGAVQISGDWNAASPIARVLT